MRGGGLESLLRLAQRRRVDCTDIAHVQSCCNEGLLNERFVHELKARRVRQGSNAQQPA